MPDDAALYLPLASGEYLATALTVGPWSPAAQHGGPPAALLGRAVEQCQPRADMMVARISCDILGPVPVGPIAVRARVVRPGRRVELIEAVLSAQNRDAMTMTAWRIQRADGDSTPGPAPVPVPATGLDIGLPGAGSGSIGYFSALEWRGLSGRFDEPGRCTVWTRLHVPLVDGESPSPLTRVLAIADSGNGISSVLDWRTDYFINPELTVHLHREPISEWILLDAVTTITRGGAGLATSVLSDIDGPIGRGAQALLIGPR